MSLARGKYGIEFNPRQLERNSSSGLGWVFAAVAVIAFISLVCSLVGRFRSGDPADADIPPSETVELEPPPAPPPPDTQAVERVVIDIPVTNSSAPGTRSVQRPAIVKNLIMRLEAAVKRQDLEMAVTTIEQIRSLPGSPASDLDDRLARELGDLNFQRLFSLHCAQWVKAVKVRGGDSASRIAREHGSTFASLAHLNQGQDINRIRVGQMILVMDHPRFRLEVNRASRTADLFLNGKFFRRYDLIGYPDKGGQYEFQPPTRKFFVSLGIAFKKDSAAELELLLPKGTPVTVR